MGTAPDASFDAFISHNRKDKDWVRTFVHRLKALKVRVWFDEDEIEWGEPILHAVERGLLCSRHVIVVMSRSSLGGEGLEGSPWVELEMLIASTRDPSNRGRTLLPLKLDDCEIPARLKPFLYLNVSTPEALEANLPRILKALGKEHEGAVPPTSTKPSPAPAAPGPTGASLNLASLREELGRYLQQHARMVMLCGDAGIPAHRVPNLGSLELSLGQLLPELAADPQAPLLKALLRAVIAYYPQAELRVTRATLHQLGG